MNAIYSYNANVFLSLADCVSSSKNFGLIVTVRGDKVNGASKFTHQITVTISEIMQGEPLVMGVGEYGVSTTRSEDRPLSLVHTIGGMEYWPEGTRRLPVGAKVFSIGETTFLSKLQKRVDELMLPVLQQRTISSIIGANWSQTVNYHHTVSGQDRIHSKTALLTFGQIFEFYKNARGVVDFGHFTTLKDLATNCSMSLGRGVVNFHTQTRASGRSDKRHGDQARSDSGKLTALERQVADQAKQIADQAKQIAELRAMMQSMMARR